MTLYPGFHSNHGWQAELYLCGARGSATYRISRKELKEQLAPRGCPATVCQHDPVKQLRAVWLWQLVGFEESQRKGDWVKADFVDFEGQ